ncbi:hypothetical protein [Fibrisoma montanum]|nr:hypothetical protein [Fibrisoma montanum]
MIAPGVLIKLVKIAGAYDGGSETQLRENLTELLHCVVRQYHRLSEANMEDKPVVLNLTANQRSEQAIDAIRQANPL